MQLQENAPRKIIGKIFKFPIDKLLLVCYNLIVSKSEIIKSCFMYIKQARMLLHPREKGLSLRKGYNVFCFKNKILRRYMGEI